MCTHVNPNFRIHLALNFIPQKSFGTTNPSQPSQRNMVNFWPSTKKKKHLLLVGWWFCMAKIQRISFYASSRWLCKRPSLIMKKNMPSLYMSISPIYFHDIPMNFYQYPSIWLMLGMEKVPAAYANALSSALQHTSSGFKRRPKASSKTASRWGLSWEKQGNHGLTINDMVIYGYNIYIHIHIYIYIYIYL